MESLFILCAVALGGIFGGVIGWQMRGGRAARLEERAERASTLESQLTKATAEMQTAKEQAHELEVELGSLKARFDAHQADEAQKKLDQERMVATFKAAAHEIVAERSKAFDTSSKKQIGDLVNPLKVQLDDFQKQLRESAKDASRERTTLEAEVKHLKEMKDSWNLPHNWPARMPKEKFAPTTMATLRQADKRNKACAYFRTVLNIR